MKILLGVLLLSAAWAQDAPPQAPAQTPPAQPPAAQPAPAGQATAPAAAPPAAQSPVPSTEQWLTGSIDLGFRWVPGVGGSLPTYRSVVNQRQGPELFGIDFTITDPKKRFFDTIDARGYGWGSEPYNTAHVDARKLGIYDFTFDYRNIAYFNALPSFANPFAPGGFDQQSFDNRIRTLTAGLDLLTGGHVIPYLAFERNSFHGSGIQTWAIDSSNQYPVPALFRDSTNNYRGGVRFEYDKFHVTLEQGGTTFKNDDGTMLNGPTTGDATTPILGQTLFLSSLNQAYAIRGSAIYSRGLLTATPLSWLTITGQFLYSQPKVDVHYTNTATGNLLLLSSLLFYSGQSDLATGTAKQPHITGNFNVEVRPIPRLRIIQSWMTDRFHDTAVGLLSTLYFTPTTAAPTVLAQQLTTQPDLQVVNYNQEEVQAIYDLTGKITLRGGYRHVWGDATVLAGQLSQTGTFASGLLRRNVALAGATVRPVEKLRITLDYEGASSDDVYFRTSLNDYQRARARASYQATPSLSFAANFLVLHNQNPAPSVNFDFLTRDSSLSVTWTPNSGKRFSILGEYDRATVRSDINYLSLPFLNTAVSSYRDNAHIASGLVSVTGPSYNSLTPTLQFGGSLLISSGSRPTTFYEPLARLAVPITKNVSWRSEWSWYGMGEGFYIYEGFRAHMVTTGLRFTR